MPLSTINIIPAAVLFDMDGTLTEPMLDFPAIKREMGIGDVPILETIAEMPPDARMAAEAILERHEEEAARNSTLNPGCRELLDYLAERKIATALITRNSRANVRRILERHRLPIEVLIAREDAEPKPSPEPLWEACRRLGVNPANAWMVGDGAFDIQAGLAAGIRTVWVSHRRAKYFAETPCHEVVDLHGIRALLSTVARIAPSPGTPGEGWGGGRAKSE